MPAAVLVSLLAHALLLSLSLGGAGLGLPGLQLPWKERRLGADELRIVLAAAPLAATPADKQVKAGSVAPAPRPSTVKEAAVPMPVPTPPPEPVVVPDAPATSMSAVVKEIVVPDARGELVQERLEQDARDAALEQARREAERLRQLELEAKAEQEAARQEQRLAAERAEQAAKQEAARLETERIALARQEDLRRETQRLEQIRQDELARREAARQDAERAEAARLESARADALRQEQARLAQQEALQQEQQRQELARAQQAAKREAERLENERLEAVRQEAARQEAARQEAARQELARQEAARQQAAKLEAARQDAARQEAARQEAARQEAARREQEGQELAQRAKAEQEAKREERLRAIGRQLAEEAAQRDAAANRPSTSLPTTSGLRRGWMFGRADPNNDLVLYAAAMSRKIEMNVSLVPVRETVKQPHARPVVTIAVRADGSVEKLTFVVSSGVPAIDELVRNVVAGQAPYGAFPPSLARQYDVIEIRRTWIFDMAIRLE